MAIPRLKHASRTGYIPLVAALKLGGEIFERVEGMSGVKAFVILPAAAFRLAVMARGERPDQPAGNAMRL